MHDGPDGVRTVRGLQGPGHPDGARLVRADDRDPDPAVTSARQIWTAVGRPRGRALRVTVRGATDPWFVLVGAAGRDDLVQLVAFETGDHPPGTVVDTVEAAGRGVRSDQQVGAIQWERSSGTIAQLFVQPMARGRGLARVLAYAASGVHQFHGWPGSIRSNQRRTALGERFVQTLGHPERIPPLTEMAPPMDRDADDGRRRASDPD